MKKRALLTVLVTLSFAKISYSNENSSITLGPEGYISGKNSLLKFIENPATEKYLKGQYGYVEVPLNYEVENQEKLSLFYSLPIGFDVSKPSVIYFYGGPGGSSLFTEIENGLSNYNIIYMDQRGTGFSKPDKHFQIQNPLNFSSEYIARDALAILNHLKIEKVTVYGVSYGTIPATIFSSFFPERTTSVVLEGVVFSGEETLWSAPHRIKILQKAFNKWPNELRQKIINMSKSGNVQDDWFGTYAQSYMYDRNFEKNLKSDLESLFSKNLESQILTIDNSIDKSILLNDSIYGAYMFHQIACQELSANSNRSGWGAVFNEENLEPSLRPITKACLSIPGMEDRLNRTYFSTNYPVLVPVVYVQGVLDGATTATQAIKHFKQTAKGKAQLILVKGGGHAPLYTCIVRSQPNFSSEECGEPDLFNGILDKIFQGKILSKEELETAIPNKNWVTTSKGN